MEHECSNQRPVVRSDPVTARAISRLSHGVSQLSAGSDTKQHPTRRERRCKYHPKNRWSSKKFFTNEHCYSKVDESRHGITPTGTKRKFHSERRSQQAFMEVDQEEITNSLRICTRLVLSHVKSTNSAHSLPADTQSARLIDTLEQHSSCSSMLSITKSEQETRSNGSSSQDNEADDEDANDVEQHNTFHQRRRSQSHTSLPSASSGDATQTFRRTNERIESNKCAGDSSDSLSMSIKIPRISSSLSVAFVSRRCHHRTTLGTYDSEHSSTNLNSHSPSRLRSQRLRERYSKHSFQEPKAQRSGACQSSRCFCQSSTSSSASRGDSTSPVCSRLSSASYEDLANDERSDLGEDEVTSKPDIRVIGSPARATEQSCKRSYSRLRLHGMTSNKLSRPLLEDCDSEFEDIFNGTWSLLSQTAKEAYLNGVDQAGKRGLFKIKDITITSENTQDSPIISFVQSKLTPIVSSNSLSSVTPISSEENSEINKMPTPPWLPSTCDTTVSGTVKSNKPSVGVDYFIPQCSTAPPIPMNNLGHRLLQRIGWKPGEGLGANNQGFINPVGCIPFLNKQNNSNKCICFFQ